MRAVIAPDNGDYAVACTMLSDALDILDQVGGRRAAAAACYVSMAIDQILSPDPQYPDGADHVDRLPGVPVSTSL